jgi:septal ring factor EnvC (AmiA/AmiB activator)
MELWKIITLILASTGFWKLLEILVRLRTDKKVKLAEAINLHSQAENQIVANWIQWSQMLEKRIKESEEHTEALQKVIENQRKRIQDLEKKVVHMEKQNKELINELKRIK